eukprot:COSAG02_NODE_32_length_50374_cov_46.674013_31_plen_116_part_00
MYTSRIPTVCFPCSETSQENFSSKYFVPYIDRKRSARRFRPSVLVYVGTTRIDSVTGTIRYYGLGQALTCRRACRGVPAAARRRGSGAPPGAPAECRRAGDDASDPSWTGVDVAS